MSQVSLCIVCGKLACMAVLKDRFGKSDEMVPYCSEHGPKLVTSFGPAAIDDSPSVKRAKFEKWLSDVHMLTAEWQPERSCYREFPAHLAWCAWQAAFTHSAGGNNGP